MRKWIVIGVGAAVILIVIVLGAYRAAKKREQAEAFAAKTEVAVAVEVAKPSVGDIEETEVFLGSVVSTEQATVFSKIPGKIVSVPAKVGTRVVAGSTIAVVDYDQPGMKFRYYEAYAPISGEVVDVMVSVGDMVAPTTPLATVVKPESVKVEASVPADTLATMYKGQPVRIYARGADGPPVEGKVANLPRSLSPESHMATVEFVPTATGATLRAGMFAQVEIPVKRREDVLLLAPTAVHREAEGLAVYVAAGDVIRRRAVETGLAREGAVEITGGLKGGEEVVMYASDDLADGLKITKKTPYEAHD
jgi:multidrug efflux pump subunit AcrA (membrane-fusion protein)